MSAYSTNLNFQTSRMTSVTIKKPTRGSDQTDFLYQP